MPDEPSDSGEMTDGVYQPDIKPMLTDRAARDFFPWHKPRKHYIRVYQWCAEARDLIRMNGYQEVDVLRYLGFPGEDFLDIRTLQGVCAPAKIVVRYLGFDSTASYAGDQFQFNLSRHEVFQLGFIHEHSHVLKTRLEHIAKERSMAYRKTAAYRDFDIINIDLCNSLATTAADDPYPPYFEAIKKLCDLQIAGRTRPWLLFLATRAIRDQMDSETKWKLFDCVLRNIQENAAFAAKLASDFGLDGGTIRKELSDREPLVHRALVSLFGLSIGKWLLKMMMAATPKLKVRLLKSYSYRVQVDEPDMLSLAFRFEPVIARASDRSGLTRPLARDDEPDEANLAVEMLTAVSGIEDIDQKLLDDQGLHEKMVDKCGDVLTAAHYDKERYEKWVEKVTWKPKPQKGAS
jgi:hypothetical protein